MKTRDELITLLTDHRLAAKKNVTNPSRLRELIRGDLEQLDDDELQRDYDHVTGATRRPSRDAVDYRVTELDHAISLAIVCLDRGFDAANTRAVLLAEYPASIAGRALSVASDGAFKIDMGRQVDRQPDLATAKPLTLGEYLAANPTTTLPAADEPAA